MADDGVRTLTEKEAYAIAAAEVKRETAELQQTINDLQAEKAKLESEAKAKLQETDVQEAALTAERAKVEKAQKDLEDYKAQVEREREIAARKEDRVKRVREVVKHLNDGWFVERAERWAVMDDDSFDTLIREFAAVSDAAEKSGETSPDQPPRETAMEGAPVSQGKKTGALREFFGGVK